MILPPGAGGRIIEIKRYRDAFVHRAMILMLQFRADDVRIQIPESPAKDTFGRQADCADGRRIDIDVLPLAVEENERHVIQYGPGICVGFSPAIPGELTHNEVV